jgi:subtilisin-like proprotein convertase family protein
VLAGPLLRDARAKAQPDVLGGAPRVTSSTDSDAFLEPGETAVVRVPVTNVGDATAKRVSVTLTSPTDDVTVRPAIASYGSVKPGATKARSYEVTAPRTTPMGSDVRFSVRVRFAGRLSPQASTGSVMAGQPSSRVLTRAFTGPAVNIPDNSPGGVSVPLRVDGVGQVSRVTFSIDGTGCAAAGSADRAGLQHSYVGDLVGALRGPDGTGVTLFRRVGADGDNFCRAVFTDSASRQVQTAGPSDAPFTGSWQPTEPLSAFLGKPGDGTWTFTVSDLASSDTGALRAVSVHVSGFEPPPS